MASSKVFALKCAVQQYAWGKKGEDSAVAQLKASVDPDFTVDPNATYAEAHAAILHKEHPEIYKDPNHKPEMAIALTPFVGLCGFRPIQEVAHFLKTIEEFKEAVGGSADKMIEASLSSNIAVQKDAMKCCFKGLMEREKATVTSAISALVTRVREMKNAGDDISSVEGEMLLKLDSEFPGDAGGFAIYFLNIVYLEPGEAMFLEANLPHAYLSGDCMECMACSDNVVRAGLTPKYIDVETLCEMLDYSGRPVDHRKFLGIESHGNINITIFNPPVPDFGVSKFELPEGKDEFDLLSFESASICIIIKGEGEATSPNLSQPMALKKGSVFFVCADVDVHIKTSGQGMLLFRAYVGVL